MYNLFIQLSCLQSYEKKLIKKPYLGRLTICYKLGTNINVHEDYFPNNVGMYFFAKIIRGYIAASIPIANMMATMPEYVIPVFIDKICSRTKLVVPMNIQ